ncbi:LexA family transcriptional regulator [uncultured Alcanivorax sp.]|jgi:SOS-response transcriptional repressor LexA|uniref:LexA family protein n=2 Tax=Gammaproteobacteria TaxID=1236 RepID=UPI0025CDC1E4|nr:XRE family transcriptional regulator [uncultured Alcanivorax sp.]
MNDTTYAHKARVEALRTLVLEYGSQAKFARKFGLDASYISQILSGHRAFGEKSARNMEQKLGIPLGALDGRLIANEIKDSNVEPAYVPHTARSAPVISWVQAGEWAEAVDLYSVGEGESREETPANAGPHAFWLRVKGDSMTAPAGLSVPEGYLIMVDPDTQPENGSLVVAKLDSEDEATFKKLVIDGPNRYLKPLNTAYDTIKINGNCRIVGTVKEIRFRP